MNNKLSQSIRDTKRILMAYRMLRDGYEILMGMVYDKEYEWRYKHWSNLTNDCSSYLQELIKKERDE